MAACADCHRESPAGASYCAFCGAALVPSGDLDAAQALVGGALGGRYFLHALIGRGGMGDVYRATDLPLDRTVVVKVLRRVAADPGAVRRFHREAQVAARLAHPNAVTLLDSGETETGTLYMVMEHVPGETLAHLIATAWPIGERRTVEVGAQILAALVEAHAAGIIHRDLKPANVMVEARDGVDRVKVLDFGIATLTEGDVEARLTRTGTVFGTPAYMSPEQIRGERLDPRSDLYAVGIILYEALTGRLPFEAPTPMGLATRHLTDPPPTFAQVRPGLRVTPALEALVRAALSKDRAARPASAEAFRAALAACPVGQAPLPAARAPLPPTLPLEGVTAVEGAPPPAGGPAPSARWRRARWALGSTLAAAVVATGAWWLRPPTARPPPAAPRAPVAPAETTAARAIEQPPSARPDPAAVAPRAPGAQAAPEAPAVPRPAPRAAPPAPSPRTSSPAIREPSGAPPARSVIRAVRGELDSLPLPAAESGEGLLAIEASPWAEVSVDGQALGETPRELQITAGRHRVRAVHPELGAREGWVVVEAGARKVWLVELGK